MRRISASERRNPIARGEPSGQVKLLNNAKDAMNATVATARCT
jgi:hypothetical protein